ncbi:MAG: aldo/keto reductase [Solirubrobacteraceae bacterium]
MLLGETALDVFPLCLGGNVFGRGAGEEESFAVLDAYVEAGGNFIDTADIYADGSSEEILGNWMAARRNRDQIVLATKVGMARGSGLSSEQIERAVRGSLERLRTDRIDLYYAHQDDQETPLHETLAAFDALVEAGTVRHIAASNYDASRLAEALDVSAREGLVAYVALQPHYNLLERGGYEGALQELCVQRRLACLPYYALAQGFLTGKYRPGGPRIESRRAQSASSYLDERGLRVLAALDEIAASHETTLAAVALAWLLRQDGVLAPIASARTVEQLYDLLGMASLPLADAELERLTTASA